MMINDQTFKYLGFTLSAEPSKFGNGHFDIYIFNKNNQKIGIIEYCPDPDSGFDQAQVAIDEILDTGFYDQQAPL